MNTVIRKNGEVVAAVYSGKEPGSSGLFSVRCYVVGSSIPVRLGPWGCIKEAEKQHEDFVARLVAMDKGYTAEPAGWLKGKMPAGE